MSWDAAVAFRAKVQADRAADGLSLSPGSGFYMNTRIANQGQTGVHCLSLHLANAAAS